MPPLRPEQGLELLRSPNYSDLTIACEGYIFKVHKAVICPQSQFFEACARNFTEAQDFKITLLDTNPFVLSVAIHYLYTGNPYANIGGDTWKGLNTTSPGSQVSRVSAPRHLVDVYQLAYRLLIPGLKLLMASCFRMDLEQKDWSLPEGEEEPFEALASVLECVYQATPANDKLIRVDATSYATMCFTRVLKPKHLFRVLDQHEPVAFRVAMAARGVALD